MDDETITEKIGQEIADVIGDTVDKIEKIVGFPVDIAVLIHKEHHGDEKCIGTMVMSDVPLANTIMMVEQARVRLAQTAAQLIEAGELEGTGIELMVQADGADETKH